MSTQATVVGDHMDVFIAPLYFAKARPFKIKQNYQN